jgi:hypothetical protein
MARAQGHMKAARPFGVPLEDGSEHADPARIQARGINLLGTEGGVKQRSSSGRLALACCSARNALEAYTLVRPHLL